ncbi:uncharacterized protein BDV14DRAFT_196983 [Aspergillus stella-maris]|uniref:uncharacterized protein n=1 Tax=Aspergillus stella-maris TaxID=1810926 RepID=UPI003CCDC8F8
MTPKEADYDTIVIGAGFSGIRTLYELKQIGLTVKCFDAVPDVGGTWYYNRYPGSRTDCDAWVYRFILAPDLIGDWDFQERCPSQEEVQKYLVTLWRIAVVGTGSTGVQIIPKIAPAARQLTVFQRTPNYVLPVRNYNIDEYQAF